MSVAAVGYPVVNDPVTPRVPAELQRRVPAQVALAGSHSPSPGRPGARRISQSPVRTPTVRTSERYGRGEADETSRVPGRRRLPQDSARWRRASFQQKVLDQQTSVGRLGTDS